MIGVHAHHPVDHRPVSIRDSTEPVPHRDPFQYQDTAFKLDLSGRVGAETTVSGWDAARLQGQPGSSRTRPRFGAATSRRRDQPAPARLTDVIPEPAAPATAITPPIAGTQRAAAGSTPGWPGWLATQASSPGCAG
jgi:hypothetical protein